MTIKELKEVLNIFPENSKIGMFRFSSLRNNFVFWPVESIQANDIKAEYIGIEFGVPIER